MAIGDGLCDPISMTGYGNLLHGVGLINRFPPMPSTPSQNTNIALYKLFGNMLFHPKQLLHMIEFAHVS